MYTSISAATDRLHRPGHRRLKAIVPRPNGQPQLHFIPFARRSAATRRVMFITVIDAGTRTSFDVDDVMRYHGPHCWGGVVHAFKAMETAFPRFVNGGRIERRELRVRTPLDSAGARDAFEMVARCVSEGRYTLDPSLLQTDRGALLAPYFFEFSYLGQTQAVRLRPGHVRADFIRLLREPQRSDEEYAELIALDREMVKRILNMKAEDVYEFA